MGINSCYTSAHGQILIKDNERLFGKSEGIFLHLLILERTTEALLPAEL